MVQTMPYGIINKYVNTPDGVRGAPCGMLAINSFLSRYNHIIYLHRIYIGWIFLLES